MIAARNWSDMPSSGHSIAPGETPLTRICGPKSLASERVSIARPAFAAPYTDVIAQRALSVHVDDVDDDSFGRSSAGNSACERNSGAFRLLPMRSYQLLLGHRAERRRVEVRGVVDEHVEPARAPQNFLGHPLELRTSRTSALTVNAELRTEPVQLRRERSASLAEWW